MSTELTTASYSTITGIRKSLRLPGENVAAVTDFGALGDGVYDDQGAVDQAVSFLEASGGGVLYFPYTAGGGDYRFKTPNRNAINISTSNIKILGDPTVTLTLDNMSGGLATGHGVFVQGPVTNISLESIHIRYVQMAVSRQTYAPVYLLGANVGTGDISGDGWYRGEPGGENVPLIEAGSIANVSIRNCTIENSPSVFVGIINVDGIRIDGLRCKNSWADGLYHRCFRGSKVNNVVLENVGDDAISMGTEESSISGADISHAFHGEGTTLNNVTVTGAYPALDPAVPSGSIVLLGVRDLTVSNVVVQDKWKCLRVESGTETTGIYSRLNINFLANRNVLLSNIVASGCSQALGVVSKEYTIGVTDEKWWLNDIKITNMTTDGGDVPFDVYGISGGVPSPDTPPPLGTKVMAGYYIDGFKAKNYTSPYANLGGLQYCRFENFDITGVMTFAGYVPYEGDVDGDYEPNNSHFNNIKGQKIIFQGLKNCTVGSVRSTESPDVGILFTGCSDISFDSLTVTNSNRTSYEFGNGAVIDLYSKRISGNLVNVIHDSTPMPDAFSINNSFSHSVNLVKVETLLNTGYAMVSDASKNATGKSQIKTVKWIHRGQVLPVWMTRSETGNDVIVIGDQDFVVYPDSLVTDLKVDYPLTGNRTIKLMHDGVMYGERRAVSRSKNSTGAYSLAFTGGATVSSVSTYPVLSTVAGYTGMWEFMFDGSHWINVKDCSGPATFQTIKNYITNDVSGVISHPSNRSYPIITSASYALSVVNATVTWTSPSSGTWVLSPSAGQVVGVGGSLTLTVSSAGLSAEGIGYTVKTYRANTDYVQ